MMLAMARSENKPGSNQEGGLKRLAVILNERVALSG
jgi:hypothetical protein